MHVLHASEASQVAQAASLHAVHAPPLMNAYPGTQPLHWPTPSHALHLGFTMDAAQHALPRQVFVTQSLLSTHARPAASFALHTPSAVA